MYERKAEKKSRSSGRQKVNCGVWRRDVRSNHKNTNRIPENARSSFEPYRTIGRVDFMSLSVESKANHGVIGKTIELLTGPHRFQSPGTRVRYYDNDVKPITFEHAVCERRDVEMVEPSVISCNGLNDKTPGEEAHRARLPN